MNERCVLCGDHAAVRVRGTSFCASCGLNQYSPDAVAPARLNRRSRRAAFFALFSSGMLVKTLLGAVALAAVGGVAASTVMVSNNAPSVVETTVGAVSTVVDETPTTTPTTAAVAIATVDESAGDVEGYVAAMQAWADCVATAASEHSGGAFDPNVACPDKPNPALFGIGVMAGEGTSGDDDASVDDSDESIDDDDAQADDAQGEDDPSTYEDEADDGPGASELAPGHDEDGPGESENAPGHDEDGLDDSGDAPGHDEDGPGGSENAPGQNKDKDTDE